MLTKKATIILIIYFLNCTWSLIWMILNATIIESKYDHIISNSSLCVSILMAFYAFYFFRQRGKGWYQ